MPKTIVITVLRLGLHELSSGTARTMGLLVCNGVSFGATEETAFTALEVRIGGAADTQVMVIVSMQRFPSMLDRVGMEGDEDE